MCVCAWKMYKTLIVPSHNEAQFFTLCYTWNIYHQITTSRFFFFHCRVKRMANEVLVVQSIRASVCILYKMVEWNEHTEQPPFCVMSYDVRCCFPPPLSLRSVVVSISDFDFLILSTYKLCARIRRTAQRSAGLYKIWKYYNHFRRSIVNMREWTLHKLWAFLTSSSSSSQLPT